MPNNFVRPVPLSDATIRIGMELLALSQTLDRPPHNFELTRLFSQLRRQFEFLGNNLRDLYENPQNPLAFGRNSSRMW